MGLDESRLNILEDCSFMQTYKCAEHFYILDMYIDLLRLLSSVNTFNYAKLCEFN